MPKVQYSERFVGDLAGVTSVKVEAHVLRCLDSIESFPEFGSRLLPVSITKEFGDGVRKVSVRPFDLIYTYYPEQDLVRVEALVYQTSAW